MTITLALEPQDEAMLVAAAEAKGMSAGMLVHEAVEKILAEVTVPIAVAKVDRRPIWEILLEGIEDVPLEDWADLPTDGASEHDHYLYGSPRDTHEGGVCRYVLLDCGD